MNFQRKQKRLKMRIDSRKNDQLRNVKLQCGYLKNCPSSVLIEFSNTRVICSASLIEDIPSWMKMQKKSGGWLTAEYQMLPFSTKERTRREITSISGRTHEIQRLVGRSLRAAIDLEKLGARTIYIDCEVIDADGGTRCASISGGMVALRLLILQMLEKKIIEETPLIRNVAAVSVGIIDGKVMLDLCYEEDSNADTDMNVVMADDGNFIEIQSTAEKNPFSREEFNQMLELAQKGLNEIFRIQNESILKYNPQ